MYSRIHQTCLPAGFQKLVKGTKYYEFPVTQANISQFNIKLKESLDAEEIMLQWAE